MKKFLAIVIAVMMVVSMIPVMAISSSAVDVEGMWDTFRGYGSYTQINEETGEEEPAEFYTPAPGYEYTDEGFHTVPANYANTTPFFSINSKEKVDINDGFYLEIRVDNYSYAGEPAEGMYWGTADHWLSFHLSVDKNINPASNKSGQGWVSLIRHGHQGGGTAADPENIIAQAFCQYDVAGKSFLCTNPAAKIAPTVDDEGRRIYTFSGGRNSDGTYSIAICGVELGHAEADAMFAAIDPEGTGELYIGFTMNSGVKDGVAECTILKYGTSAEDATTPEGSDSKEADENPNYYGDMIDSATVPEGQPCLVFDANRTSWRGTGVSCSSMEIVEQGNGSFMITPESAVAYYTWGIKRDLTYEAADFPVIAMLVEDPNMVFMDGNLRWAVGDIMGADDIHIVPFDIYGEHCKTYGENEDIYLIVIDMKEATATELEDGTMDYSVFENEYKGRINSFRVDSHSFSIDAESPETNNFFLHYMACFRSVEDAQAYGANYIAETFGDATEVTEGEDDGDVTEPEAGDETAAPAGDETGAAGDETGAADAETKAEVADTDAPAAEGGCASVIGVASVLLAAAAVAVVLKKRD